jgi:hypothetical protein
MLVVIMFIATAWIAFIAPESPFFLLETNQYDALENCFKVISKFNGCYSK